MNRTKPILTFDADGVIVDFARILMRELNRRLGRNIAYQECHDHDLAKVYGLSVEECRGHVFEIYREIDLRNFPAIRGALDGLAALAEDFRPIIITSRIDDHREATEDWFARRGIEVKIYYSQGANNPYAGGDGRKTKCEIAQSVGARCLVEDNPHELVDWPDDSIEPICFARPWNKNIQQCTPGIKRLGWSALVRYCQSHYR